LKSPLTELLKISSADAPSVEVIFLHGLDGDAIGTWAFNTQASWHTWIRGRYPNARVWSLNYRLRSSNWWGGAMAIQDRAVNVLATLDGDVDGETPIVLVCHSYGGLLAKQILFTATGRSHNEYGRFAGRIKGLVFLGTPHNGSRIADFVKALRLFRSSVAIDELKKNAPHLRELSSWFRNAHSTFKWQVRIFFETMDTRGIRVVDEDSADAHLVNVTAIGVDVDHEDISKPTRPDVRVTQTFAVIDRILGEPPLAENRPGPSPTAKLLGTLDPDGFERLYRRYQLELKADPGNQHLINALTNFRLGSTEPKNSAIEPNQIRKSLFGAPFYLLIPSIILIVLLLATAFDWQAISKLMSLLFPPDYRNTPPIK